MPKSSMAVEGRIPKLKCQKLDLPSIKNSVASAAAYSQKQRPELSVVLCPFRSERHVEAGDVGCCQNQPLAELEGAPLPDPL